MDIIDTLKMKKLIDQNKIEEVKKSLHGCVKLTGAGYFVYDISDREIKLVPFAQIVHYLPKDLTNMQYLEKNDIKKNASTKFNSFEYLKSAEFMDYRKIVTPNINFKEKKTLYSRVEDVEGIEMTVQYINMAKPLPFTYKTLDNIKLEDHQEDIDIINKHILEVLCSGNEAQYIYTLNFLAHSCVGSKLKKALYIQSSEQTGKGIFMNFINEMLGKRMLKTSNSETFLLYSYPLEGRSLVNIDEMEKSRIDHALSDKLKGYITEPTFDCRNMYETSYVQKNTFNLIITTNNDAVSLTNQNNARYVCLDVSTHRFNDVPYFTYLSEIMNKKGIKLAYFKYMEQRYEENKKFNFNIKPQSRVQNQKLAVSMPTFLRMIKEKYILKGLGLNVKCTDLIDEYRVDYKNNVSATALHKILSDIKIVKSRIYEPSTKKQVWKFVVEKSALYKIFLDRMYIVEEFEDVEEDVDEDKYELDNDGELQYKETEVEKLKKEIEELKALLKLQSQTKVVDENPKQATEEDSEIEEATEDEIEETTEEETTEEEKIKPVNKSKSSRTKVTKYKKEVDGLEIPADVFTKTEKTEKTEKKVKKEEKTSTKTKAKKSKLVVTI